MIKVDQFIFNSNTRRGDGGTFPVRIVEEVFTFDGKLVAELDPFGSITIEQVYEFLKWHYKDTDNKKHLENIDSFFKA